MFDSKRFIAFLIGIGVFIATILFTDYPPMELSGAISMLCSVYIGGETLRGSWGPAPSKNTTVTTTTDSTNIDDDITTAINTVEIKKS